MGFLSADRREDREQCRKNIVDTRNAAKRHVRRQARRRDEEAVARSVGENGNRGEGANSGVEGKGKEETAGRYSFAVPAVVIYLKPLAVNISPLFIQRHGEASAGGGGGGKGTAGGVSSAFLLTLAT